LRSCARVDVAVAADGTALRDAGVSVRAGVLTVRGVA
jgi:hypothetical protein